MKKVITDFYSEFDIKQKGVLENFAMISNMWPPSENLECREPFTLEDGSVYTGEWKGNNRHGRGVLQYGKKTIFLGYFIANQMNGFG